MYESLCGIFSVINLKEINFILEMIINSKIFTKNGAREDLEIYVI